MREEGREEGRRRERGRGEGRRRREEGRERGRGEGRRRREEGREKEGGLSEPTYMCILPTVDPLYNQIGTYLTEFPIASD